MLAEHGKATGASERYPRISMHLLLGMGSAWQLYGGKRGTARQGRGRATCLVDFALWRVADVPVPAFASSHVRPTVWESYVHPVLCRILQHTHPLFIIIIIIAVMSDQASAMSHLLKTFFYAFGCSSSSRGVAMARESLHASMTAGLPIMIACLLLIFIPASLHMAKQSREYHSITEHSIA